MRSINCEQLEQRTLLSDPATIVWSNRAGTTTGGANDTDGFGAAFGALAPAARTVVDTIIARYDRMIGSFNYPTGGTNYNLSLSASSPDGTFSGSGVVISSSGGRPVVGAVSIAGGSNDGIANNDNGWFIDTTPTDNAEFLGTLVNAFAGDAQSGSAAQNKPDFYTAVEYQMLKALGMTSSLSGWSSHTTDTGVADSGNGVGDLWVFTGPSVKHLMSSDSDGSDAHASNRSAPAGDSISFGGDNYIGAADLGNGAAGLGRRYLLDTPFALMLKDAYGYSTVDPLTIDTLYSILNATTHQLQVRGGDFGSDNTTHSSDGFDLNTIIGGQCQLTIYVDSAVPGTGAAAGDGNPGSFFALYPPSNVTSIVMQTGRGDDVVSIRRLGTSVSCNVDLGSGNNKANIGSGDYDANILGPVFITGGTDSDVVSIDDSTDDAGFDSYFVTGSSLFKINSTTTSWSGVDKVLMNGSPQSDQVNIQALSAGTSLIWSANGGDDTFNIGQNNLVNAIAGRVTVYGGAGNDSLNYNDSASTTGANYDFTAVSVGQTSSEVITYDSTLEHATLSTSQGPDTIFVISESTGPTMSLNSNGGADVDNVICGGFTSPPAWSLPIDGGTDSAIDTITFWLDGVTPGVYAGRSASFSGNLMPTVTYSHFDTVNLYGSYNSDIILVYSTAEMVSTVIQSGDGYDIVDMGGANLGGFGGPFTLDNILGPVTVTGNVNDSLIFNDTSETSGEHWEITDTTISREDMADVTYAGFEAVNILGGSAADEFQVDSTNASEPVSIAGNAGNDDFFVYDNAPASYVTIDSGTGLDTLDVNGDLFGSAAVRFDKTQDFASINIHNGGTVSMLPNGARCINTKSLSIATSGILELYDNDLLVDYTGSTVYPAISTWIKTMRNNGAWNGTTGITASFATINPQNRTLGILEGKDWINLYSPSAGFDGFAVDNTTVLVKYTYYGDANFNGKVDGADYSRIDFGFGQHLTGWFNGDFNGDGKVNGSDYGLIDFAFGTQGTALRPSTTPGTGGVSNGDLTGLTRPR